MSSYLFRFLILLLGIHISCAPLAAENAPQQDLPHIRLLIGKAVVNAQVADTDESRAKGLMFRKSLEPNDGMLFVFNRPHRASFWMKNTLIPLSIAFIKADGVILEIQEMKALDETQITSGFDSVLFALEMSAGWFSNNHIFPGDLIMGLPKPGSTPLKATK